MARFALAVIFAVSLITTAEIVSGVGSVSAQAEDQQYTTVTKDTHIMTTGTYRVTDNVEIHGVTEELPNGIQIEKGANVILCIEKDKTLTVTGMDGIGYFRRGYAAILLPEGSTLTITGSVTVNARGGSAGQGGAGGNRGRYDEIKLNWNGISVGTSDGKVTVKKGLVKGKTYKLKYKVRIKATKNYKATKYVTRTVKIKIKK